MPNLILPNNGNGVPKRKYRKLRLRHRDSEVKVTCVGDECRKLLQTLCCKLGECQCKEGDNGHGIVGAKNV